MIAFVSLCILVSGVVSLPMDQTVQKDNSNSKSSNQREWAVCIINGKETKPGQRGTSGSFVYECRLDGNLVRSEIVACLDDGDSQGNNRGEHAINERWVEGEKPFRYVFECTKTGSITQKRPAQCFYDSAEGSVKLNPGEQQKVGKNTIGCQSQVDNGVQFNIQWGPTEVKATSVNTNANSNSNTNTNSNTNNVSSNSNSNTNANAGSTNTTSVANDAPKDQQQQLHKCK